MKAKLKSNYRVLILSALFVLIIFITLRSGVLSPDDTLHIAFVGPMSGKDQLNGQDMVRGVQLCLDQVNDAGGINGKTVKLDIFDDQNDLDLARAKALEIVEQDQALLVLGHMFSSTSIQGGEIYREFGIPAISGSATAEAVTQGNDWYFRVIPDNHSQAVFIANYVNRIMEQETVSVIYDQDVAGASLAETFKNTFRGLGGEIKYQWSIDTKAENLDEILDAVVGGLLRAERGDPGMIFLATKASESVKLITFIKRKGINYPIISTTALGNPTVIKRFKEYAEEQAKPGYFSDGIYAAAPVVFDTAGEKAQQFRNEFVAKYGQEPGLKAATYYDAALVAIQAIKRVEEQGEYGNLAEKRERTREQLASFNDIKRAVKGITGYIYFDPRGNVVKPVAIGVFENQLFISALTQLQPVTDLKRIADLERELEAGHVLIVDGKYVYRTNVVYTGIDINKVSNLATKNSSYTIDFYLWFRYQGQFDPANVEFINSEKELNPGTPIADKVLDNGMTYQAFRIKASFTGNFSFHDYPFDQQQLEIKFRHADLTRENLIYVQDMVGMRQTTNDAILAKFERAQVFSTIDDWQVTQASFFQDIMKNESTLGNPQFFDSDSDIEYSRFNTAITIKRDVLKFAIKNLLPLLATIILAYLALFLSQAQFGIKNAIGRGALMTVAFFHIKLSNDLPGIGYTIALDYVFYIIYALIILELVLTLASHKQHEKENENAARYLNLAGQVGYPIAILACGILLTRHYKIANPPAQSILTDAETAAISSENNTEQATDEKVILTLGSWRTDDIEQMNRFLAVFNAQYPHITVEFDPASDTEYDSILHIQLENGIAPDLFYLRSFSFSRPLFDAGYLEPLQDLPGLDDNFIPEARTPWATDDDEPYGVPFIATSHAIYYNIDLFERLDLQTPTTWKELLATAQAIKDAGDIPFANASGDEWSIAEIVFMNLAPNFIGGREGRLEYLSGERCFDDEHAVAAFQAVADITPFLPQGHETLTYFDSQQLFLQGEAAMWMSGSWDIPYFEDEAPDFEWDVFAVPAPAGQPQHVTFHPDVAIGLNAASKHKEEAKLFLEWLTTPESAQALSNELPGFFPLRKGVPTINNKHANAFWALNWGRGTDVRWAWPMLMDSLPDGYSLMQNSAVAITRGEMTPQQAAAALQSGLGQWFEPAQKCAIPASETVEETLIVEKIAPPTPQAIIAPDQLTIAQVSDPNSIDPTFQRGRDTAFAIYHIFDRLYVRGHAVRFAPALATSYETIDDTTWRFYLRQGVKFHNGNDFKANDVKFTLERYMNADIGSNRLGTMADVETVKIVDDYTIDIVLKYPYGPFMTKVVLMEILDEETYDEVGDEGLATRPIGTGPYKFVEWVQGERLVLQANEEHWEQAPPIKTLIFSPYPEPEARILALETELVDIIAAVPPDYQAAPGVHLEKLNGTRAYYVGLNVEMAPFDDARVRQAMNFAVDVDSIIETTLNGLARKLDGPLYPETFGYTPINYYSYDPEQARALLAQAGYPDGFEVTLDTYVTFEKVATALIAQYAEVGIKINLNIMEKDACYAKYEPGDSQLFMTSWGNIEADADPLLFRQFYTDRTDEYTNYSNPAFDKLVEAGRSTLDSKERLAIYKQALEILIQDAPWVYLYNATGLCGVSERVQEWNPRQYCPDR